VTEVTRLLAANAEYVPGAGDVTAARPKRRLALITCMDARIDVFAALGLHLGEAHILRNAGGRVTDDVLRSLALSSHVLGVVTAVVMQHTRCGLEGMRDDELQRITGADLGFLAIDDHERALAEDVDRIVAQPYLAPITLVAGLLYDVETGKVREVVRRERDF